MSRSQKHWQNLIRHIEEQDARDRTSPDEDIAEALEVLRSGDLVAQAEQDLADIGIEGEEDLRLTIFLVGTSRLLRRPLHAIIQGDSSTGKTFVVEQVARLFPPEALVVATHLSPKALYRMDSVSHRWLVLGERSRSDGDEQEDATKALRELQSSGRLTSRIVEEGKLVSRMVEGPIASTETTTKQDIFDEDANRCLLLSTDESPTQTRRILAAAARRASGMTVSDDSRLIARHHAMQRVLAEGTPHDVIVPFAGRLADAIPDDRAEARRAFPMLLSVIRASAVLHRFQRETSEGLIVATIADYALARRLVGATISTSTSGAPTEPVQRFAEKLLELVRLGDIFDAPDIAARVGRSRQRINELLIKLRPFGFVEQVEKHQGPNPARWRLVLPRLPAVAPVLPDPASLA